MKFLLVALALVAAFLVDPTRGEGDELECSHGKLYVMDDSTSKIHVFDTAAGHLDELDAVETTLALPARGAGGLTVYGSAADPLVVQFRGEAPDFDGFVRFIDTGLRLEDHGDHSSVEFGAPSVFTNAEIECHRPIHQVRHDNKIAIFCDGAFDAVPPENTTVFVVDTNLLGGTESAVVQQLTLEGSHHGVAIPVDDGHLLHSLPLTERVLRVEGASSLPSTFTIVDLQGNLLSEQLADTSSPDTHCSGFHGSAAQSNTFFLACDAAHGGVVIVEYNPTTESYTSRAVLYPTEFEDMRVGSFAYQKKNPDVVGSFSATDAAGETFYGLMALSAGTTTVTNENILILPENARQCSFLFEAGFGEHMLVLMPDGMLNVYKVENGSFTAVASKQVVPGMVSCSEAVMTVGVNQAFIATPADKKMHGVSLHHVDDGEIEVYTATLPFTPTAMTVAGFEEADACLEVQGEEHNHGSSGARVTVALSAVLVAGVGFLQI